jgi:polar amino acid transport system substrate-binding protein
MSNPLRQNLRRTAVATALLPVVLAVAACGAVVDADPVDTGLVGPYGMPADVVEHGTLTVATGQNTVPTHFLEDGQLVGFNVDITSELSERLGVELELVQVPFDSVIPGILSGRYDTALYNVSDNASRRESVDFVDYAKSGSVVVTRDSETGGITTDPLSLCGVSVALTAGINEFQVLEQEVSPRCAGAGRPPIELQTFDSDTTVRQALLAGRVDAMVDGLTATPYMVSQNESQYDLVGKLDLPADMLGMPFAKDRRPLVEAFQRAWADMLGSGDFGRLAEKWELTALVPEDAAFFTINSGEGFGDE